MSGATRVRLARITDLAALATLSRTASRSLGLPIGLGALGLFRLARMPISLLRPSDLIWVHEYDGALDGLARVERDDHEWSLVELSAQGDSAGDVRHALLSVVVREAAKQRAERIYAACADRDGNRDLLMAGAFQPYALETLLLRPATPQPINAPVATMRDATVGDALNLLLHHRTVTPAPVVRIEQFDAAVWERVARGTFAPRSSITPLLRLVDGTTFIVDGGAGNFGGWLQIGVAREEGPAHPHALRLSLAPSVDALAAISAGIEAIAVRAGRAGTAENATLAAARSYEVGIAAALEAAAFAPIGELHLFVREIHARERVPGLIPAIG